MIYQRRILFRKSVILGALIAFVLLGVLAGLPHSHEHPAASTPHPCWICRAHSVQSDAPPADVTVSSLTPLARAVLPLPVSPSFHQDFSLPDARAPPQL